MFDRGGDAGPENVRLLLAELAAGLAAATAPTEPVFLEVGGALAATVTGLQGIAGDFAELSAQIEGEDAVAAVAGIERAIARVAELSGDGGGGSAGLAALAGDADQLTRRLEVLRGVAGEVGVLAMNAKIQASQLTTGAADFTVFTAEMSRLAALAQGTIDRAAAKVVGLSQVIRQAHADESRFARTSRSELDALGRRLAEGGAELAARRRAAAAAAEQVRVRSAQEAGRVAQAIEHLQINDIASQRIDHVRQALLALDGVLAEDGAAGCDGQALAAAVCRLQQVQLDRTAQDYVGQMENLTANLRGMAADARAILDEARAAFSDGGGGRVSFAGRLEADIGRAIALLDEFIAAQARVAEVTDAVHAGVAEIVGELSAVTSIDADMQVMGLNATLKCGRLGGEGRALGVIAHELRACSRRTEDNARNLDILLDRITGAGAGLHDREAGEGHRRLADLRAAMQESLARLNALADLLDAALGRLDGGGVQAIRRLEDMAGGIRVHHDVAATLGRVSARLAELGRAGGAEAADDVTLRERLNELLSKHYTMASERLVHQLVADDQAAVAGHEPAAAVDDCFL